MSAAAGEYRDGSSTIIGEAAAAAIAAALSSEVLFSLVQPTRGAELLVNCMMHVACLEGENHRLGSFMGRPC